MTKQEFGRLTGILGAGWPDQPLDAEHAKFYAMELESQDFEQVLAAVRVIARDGGRLPSAGAIRRKLAELAIDAPGWEEVRRSLNERQRDRERRAAVPFVWTCPEGVCDGSAWILRAADAVRCPCFPQRLAARRVTTELPPLVQQFIDQCYVTLGEVAEVCDHTRRDRSTLEAQMREKWRAFVEDQVRSLTYADLPAAPELARIERARSGGALRKLDPLKALTEGREG